MARSDRKLREFERREQEILDAALSLCATPEFESITMGQIAERADVGKGTLYNHFASRDEMLFRLMLRFYAGLLGELHALPPAEPLMARFRQVIEHALHYHLENREYRYIVQYCDRIEFKERAEPAWRDDFLTLDRAFEDWATPLLEAGMENGVMKRHPVRCLLLGLHACFKGAVAMLWAGANWCPCGGDQATVISSVTRFMLAGLVGNPEGEDLTQDAT
ncbi:MAG: TetR/AcrR family transcriptional regulator [Chromatiaceae bacterium]|jgi:AcrR family transcriptional regulator|nr:TetR/AcrR family transcriptional regulator [Chromatiaceae bacterium]